MTGALFSFASLSEGRLLDFSYLLDDDHAVLTSSRQMTSRIAARIFFRCERSVQDSSCRGKEERRRRGQLGWRGKARRVTTDLCLNKDPCLQNGGQNKPAATLVSNQPVLPSSKTTQPAPVLEGSSHQAI
ncbi:Hypp528 [Branchiostoma lanceolatum]|uniref:Hypp528 protein n=1 Tax=Branchiostoma lanceolatum TaxID=7740 RepID=A0A8J9VB46_BRALA|nr:Hypp528 [Branchiostoma lanceolatum]